MVRDEHYENIYWKMVNSYAEYKDWLFSMWDTKTHYYEFGKYSFDCDKNLFEDDEVLFFDVVKAIIDKDMDEYPDVHDIDKTYTIKHKPDSYPAVCIYEYDMKQILFMEMDKLLKD